MQPVLQTEVPACKPAIRSFNWLRDPETGFIYQDIKSISCGFDFTLDKKIEFVAAYKAMFPNLTGVCEQVGISRMTYYNHLRMDSAFKIAIDEIKEQRADKIESALFQVAVQPKPSSFMAQIAVLRAYRPALYTERKININARDLDSTTVLHKQQALDSVIDAELVQGPGPMVSQPVINGPIPINGLLVPSKDDKKTGNLLPGPL